MLHAPSAPRPAWPGARLLGARSGLATNTQTARPQSSEVPESPHARGLRYEAATSSACLGLALMGTFSVEETEMPVAYTTPHRQELQREEDKRRQEGARSGLGALRGAGTAPGKGEAYTEAGGWQAAGMGCGHEGQHSGGRVPSHGPQRRGQGAAS